MRKTKIICTLGPATKDDEVLKQLMENGMDVARINFSHGSQAEHKVTMDRVKKMRKELGRPVGILLDTSGPEIRIGQLEGGRAELLPGDTFKLTTNDIMGNKISEENISNSDMLLTIQTDKTGLLETEKLDDCYKYGYRQTIENMDKIKEIMDN